MKLTTHQTKILEQSAKILEEVARYEAASFTDCEETKRYFSNLLVGKKDEVFTVLFLDSQHRLIEKRDLFHGTINAAAVYPRVVVRTALELNAASIICGHNHPSGVPEPSQADIRITERLTEALALMDIRLLDHIVVGHTAVSMAARGMI